MSERTREFLLRLLAIVGFGASTFLLVDYLHPAPLFCDPDGGCEQVRMSRWSSFLGLPTPVYGVVFFGVTLILALLARQWARRVLAMLAGTGAVGALAFISLQIFVIRAVCPWCMVVDVAAVLLAMVAYAARVDAAAARRYWPLAFAGLALAVAAVPVAIGRARVLESAFPAATIAETLPEPIAREQRQGMATVVVFVDFECPHCRVLHQQLEEAMRGIEQRVQVVRKQWPLTEIHPHAETAARAACCGDRMGVGDALAELLYAADPPSLTLHGCMKLAEKLGLEPADFQTCMTSPETDACLRTDARDAAVAGVPLAAPIYWIGRERFEGGRPPAVLRAALDRALVAAN